MGEMLRQPTLKDTVLWEEFSAEHAFKSRFSGMSENEYIDACMEAEDVLGSFCKDSEISVRSVKLFNINLLKLFHVLFSYCVDKRTQMFLDVETLNSEYVQKADMIITSIKNFLGKKPRSRKIDLDKIKISVERLSKYGDDGLDFNQRSYFLRDFQCALQKLIALVREHLICFSQMYTKHVRVAVLDVLDLKGENTS